MWTRRRGLGMMMLVLISAQALCVSAAGDEVSCGASVPAFRAQLVASYGVAYEIETPLFSGDVTGDGVDDLIFVKTRAVAMSQGIPGTCRFGPPLTLRHEESLTFGVGDFDLDGKRDVVVAKGTLWGDWDISWIGNWGGGAWAPTTLPVCHQTSAGSLAVGDVGASAAADVVVGTSNTVEVCLNTGDGTFSKVTAFVSGPTVEVSALAIGDVDGDGLVDIVGVTSSSYVSVLFSNSGTGEDWSAPVTLTVAPAAITKMVLFDVPGTGQLDILIFTSPSSGAYRYTHTGARTFAAPASIAFSAGAGFEGFSVSLNRERVPVLWLHGASSVRWSPYDNTTGDFDPAYVDWAVQVTPKDVLGTNGATDPCLVVVASDAIETFPNATGDLASPVPAASTVQSFEAVNDVTAVAIGDLNGDGIDDVVASGTRGVVHNLYWTPGQAGVSVSQLPELRLINQTDRPFEYLFLANVSGSRALELVVGSEQGIEWFPRLEAPSDTVHVGSPVLLCGLSDLLGMAVGDADGDGRMEVLALNSSMVFWCHRAAGSDLWVPAIVDAHLTTKGAVAWVNGSRGSGFAVASTQFVRFFTRDPAAPPGVLTRHIITGSVFGASVIAATDVTDDGVADLVVGADATLWLIPGDTAAASGFGEAVVWRTLASSVLSLVAIEQPTDGRPSVAWATATASAWVPNLGGGAFGVPQTLREIEGGFGGVAVYGTGDMNGDGVADIVGVVVEPVVFTVGVCELEVYSVYPEAPPVFFGTPEAMVDAQTVDGVLVTDILGDGDVSVLVWAFSSTLGVHELRLLDAATGTDHVLAARAEAPAAVAAADLDRDGLRDLLVAWSSGVLEWSRNLGEASESVVAWGDPTALSAGWVGVTQVLAVDARLDGSLDVVVVHDLGISVISTEPTSPGTVTVRSTRPLAASPAATGLRAEAVDGDGDGAVDLVVAGADSTAVVWYRFLAATGNWSAALPGCAGGGGLTTGVDALAVGRLGGPTALASVVVAENATGAVGWCNLTSGALTAVGVVPGVDAVFVADLDGDTQNDVLAVASSPGHVFFYLQSPAPGAGAVVFEPVQSFATPPPPLSRALAVADWNLDGSPDLVWRRGLAVQLQQRHGPLRLRAPTAHTVSVPSDVPTARGDPGTLAFLASAAALGSRCVSDTVHVRVLRPEFRVCGHLRHHEVTWAVTVSGTAAAPVRVACAEAGVAFEVTSAGHLTLAHWEISGMRTTAAVGPGLRAVGAGSVLEIRESWVRDSHSLASSTALPSSVGTGGALRGEAGATVRVVNSRLSNCSASSTGGAVVGVEASLELVGTTIAGAASSSGGGVGCLYRCALFTNATTIEGCRALHGAAVYVSASSTAHLAGSWVRGNTANGAGGGVAVEALPEDLGKTTSLWLEDTVLEDNVALGVGGALSAVTSGITDAAAQSASSTAMPRIGATAAAAIGEGAPAQVVLTGVQVTGNTATYGGGLFACGVAVAVDGTPQAWAGNTGTAGASADVFVCALSPEVRSPFVPDAASRAGIPWVRLATDALLAGLEINGPLHRVDWETPPAPGASLEAMAGSGVRGLVVTYDWLGTPTPDSNGAVQVAYTLPSEPPLAVAQPTLVVAQSLPVALPGSGVLVATSALGALPASVGWWVGLQCDGCGAIEGSLTVGDCAVGYGGTQVRLGWWGCEACPQGTMGAGGSFAGCRHRTPCPDNSEDRSTSTSEPASCVCKNNFFAVTRTRNASALECQVCPAGAICVDGNPPSARPGFWGTSNASFVPCLRPDACPGGPGCSPGYTGYMCNDCTSGYASDSAGYCRECPAASEAAFATVLLLLAAGGVVAAVALGFLVTRQLASDNAHAVVRTRAIPGTLGMVLVALQVVGMVGSAHYDWPETASDALTLFNIFSLDPSAVMSSECAMASFHAEYALSVMALLLWLAWVCLLVLVLRATGRLPVVSGGLVQMGVRDTVDAVFFSLGTLLYIPVARASLTLFACTRLPSGDMVLLANPGVACFDAKWWAVFPVGILATAYVVALPAYGLVSMHHRRHKLFSDVRTFSRFGCLYRLYRRAYAYVGLADLLQRLAIVVISLFFVEQQVLQVALMLCVLLVVAFGIVRFAPFFHPLYNRTAFHLVVVLVVLVMIGFTSYAQRGTTSMDTTVVVATLLTVVVLLALSAFAIVTDIRQISRERKQQYSAADERRRRLEEVVAREMLDIGAPASAAQEAAADVELDLVQV